MADEVAPVVRPKQSTEYKFKSLAQLLVIGANAFGVELDPMEIASLLGGIEAGYAIFRRFKPVKA